MTRNMKIVVTVTAAVLVFGTGFAVVAARPWSSPSSPMPAVANGMMVGSMMPGEMMVGSMMNGGMMSGGMMNGGMMNGGMMSGGMMNGGQMGSMMSGGWSGDDATPAAIEGASQAMVTADDLRFSPTTLGLKVGEPVNVVVRNSDEVVHDFTIPALGIHVTVQPGQDATFGLRPTTAGTYPFLCTIDGHARAGMRGTVTVES